MPESRDIKGIIRHVAGIIIGELKLEDITPDTFNPDMDLVDELEEVSDDDEDRVLGQELSRIIPSAEIRV